MPKYLDARGTPVESTDPTRLVWYSAGRCGYWTDDWDSVATSRPGGIPCCPACGAVGFQATAGDWRNGAAEFERNGHPAYTEFLEEYKETCGGHGAKTFLESYADWWLKRKEAGGTNVPT